MNKAKEAQCEVQMSALATAIESYRAEYGNYPNIFLSGAWQDSDYPGSTSGSLSSRDLVGCLMGKVIASGNYTNPRGLSLFSPKEVESGKGGLFRTTAGIHGYFDPWGRPFVISFDYDGNGKTYVGQGWGGWGPLDGSFFHDGPLVIMSKGKDPLDPATNIWSIE